MIALHRSLLEFRTLLPALALYLASCISTSTQSVNPNLTEGPWVQPTPAVQKQLDDQVSRVPYLQRPEDILEVLEFFVGVGESAYTTLLENAASPNPKVSSMALAALGSSADERLVPYLQELPEPPAEARMLRYEWARCLVKLGDWAPMHVLVAGLADEELIVRAQCYKTLHKVTNQKFGYHPQAEPEVREASIQRWREWLSSCELEPSAGVRGQQ